jgi:hypothetical protein
MVAVRRSGVGEKLPYVLVPRNKRSKKMKGGGVSRNEKGRPQSSNFLSQSLPSIHHIIIHHHLRLNHHYYHRNHRQDGYLSHINRSEQQIMQY